MTWLIVAITLFVVFGPLRRFAFRGTTIIFTVAALIGGGIGLYHAYRSGAHQLGIPGIPLIMFCFAAGVLGFGTLNALGGIFANKRDRK